MTSKWTEFLKRHKGEGKDAKELSLLYQKENSKDNKMEKKPKSKKMDNDEHLSDDDESKLIREEPEKTTISLSVKKKRLEKFLKK